MIGTPPPNRDRFLCAIAERVSPDRVQAVFLFPPIRQGPVETCVAVLAVAPVVHVTAEIVTADSVTADSVTADSVTVDSVTADSVTADSVTADSVTADSVTADSVPESPVPSPQSPPKPTVLTARYRHTLKGADRGKWELEILEQADAPLVTIETVVRGVQTRLDDQAEPERLGADDLRTALVEGVWTTPAR